MASGSNFRARRLSVADLDTSEFEKANSNSASPQPGQRQRRLSLSPEMGAKIAQPAPFPTSICGTFSCHGVEPGSRQGQTNAKINQDRGGTSFPLGHAYKNISCTEALFAVYDGHGANGDKVSQFVVQTVPELLAGELALLDVDTKDKAGQASVAQALKNAFVKTDEALSKNKDIDAELSGTTAVAVLVRQYAGQQDIHMWTAWAGDSRAVIWTTAKAKESKDCNPSDVRDLSHDHKPNTPSEQARITKSGGFVSPPEEEWGGPARVWLDGNMTLPGLAMGRSIGDHLVKKVGVIAEPDVTYDQVSLSDGKQRYIVLASDGVWEFIESHSAMKLIAKFIHDGAEGAVTKLIETSAAKWRQEEGDYRDDITATCIALHDLVESAAWKGACP